MDRKEGGSMTIQAGIKMGASIAAVVVLALAFRSWLSEHDARINAESTVTAQSQIIEDAQAKISAAKQSEAQNQSNLAEQLKAIAAQRTVIVTPQQAAQAIPAIIPNLPQPVEVQSVPATPTAPPTQNLVIPQADIPAFQSYKLDCDQKGVELSACKLTTDNTRVQLAATADQLKATEIERDAFKKAAHGTFWSRLGHSAKCIGLSGLGGAAGAYFDKQNGGRGGAIGAGLGAITCELWR